MSGLQLITTALAAGAGVGAKDVASAAVKDAYTGFKDLLTRRLARHGTAPRSWRAWKPIRGYGRRGSGPT